MIAQRVLLVTPAAVVAAALVTAAAGVAAGPKAPPTTHQCTKVKDCVTVTGPWVAVPAQGEVGFLLECPKRKGVIAGFDALASSADVRVSWDAKLGAPVRAGTSTISVGFFRAESASGRQGVFQPVLGCVPPPKQATRQTASARVTHPGAPLDRWQTMVSLKPGTRTGARTCGKKGEHPIDGWSAVAFDTKSTPPSPALADKVHVRLTVGDARVVAAIQTDAGMPVSAFARVQVGAVCAK
jgi:hypothetical protein